MLRGQSGFFLALRVLSIDYSGMNKKAMIAAVVVASLGYFVDIYDLILFSIVRVPSLQSLGLEDAALLDEGIHLLNLQMSGMLLGGIIFGVLGDKRGRLSVLFGSILLYSIANLLNGFAQTIEQYAALRFIAGIGLAGELGAGITLVSETLPKEKRGYGTTIIASLGVCGAMLAWFIADRFDWRNAYIIGGVMGLALLVLRLGVIESGLYEKVKQTKYTRGDFLSLFKSKEKFFKLLACISVGVPIWYVVGILITLSPEFSAPLQIDGVVSAGKAVFFNYFGLALGDLGSGLLSQYLKSRKKSLFIFMAFSIICILAYFFLRGLSVDQFYFLCFVLGISIGYWAMFATISAEQFGTNIRATAATSAPNFVRGSLVLISLLFTQLKPHVGLWSAGLLTGVAVMSFAIWGYMRLTETFHKDLDYHEA